ALSQEVIEHEIGDLQAKDPTCAEIESEMLSGEDPTQGGFLGGRGKRLERAFCPGHHFGRDAELEGLGSKDVREHCSCGSADDRVLAGVRSSRRRLAARRPP